MKRFFQIAIAVLFCGLVFGSLAGASKAAEGTDRGAHDPLNTTYRIEGRPVALVDGLHESPAAPGSATMVRTTVWQHPVFGDLDGDGDPDAALLLVHDPGGSGTFFYVGAAIHANGRYQGIDTVWLGDRIKPVDIAIRNRTVVVNYLDRRRNEPFSIAPSVDRAMASILQDGQLSKAPLTDGREEVTRGWVAIGHEVRSFRPCDGENELWLMGSSPALKGIIAAYRRAVPDRKNYSPVFMVLVGVQVDSPLHGFGADYRAGFRATSLVRAAPDESCETASPSAASTTSVGKKIAFDTTRLDDEGLLGPPGGKRALSYEFCIPDRAEKRYEVKRIDPTVRFFSASTGRIGCGSREILCIGSTHQKDFFTVLQRLAELSYISRIEQSFFE